MKKIINFFALTVLLACNTKFVMAMVIKPCTEWNVSRKANLSTVVQREWVYGYLSGLSDALKFQTGKDVSAQLPPNEEIVTNLNNYCEMHPQDSVSSAVLDLFKKVLSEVKSQ